MIEKMKLVKYPYKNKVPIWTGVDGSKDAIMQKAIFNCTLANFDTFARDPEFRSLFVYTVNTFLIDGFYPMHLDKITNDKAIEQK